MKLLFIFFLHVFSFCICFSQEKIYYKKDSSLILNTDYVQYELEYNEKSNLAGKLPFSKITFFDVRYDTSFIAINWQVNRGPIIGKKKYNKKFNLTGGVASILTDYFNEYYKDNFSGNNDVLLCYVKKFAITVKDTLAEYRHANASINNIKLELECFYKQGGLLFPAIRLDTTYAETIPRIKKTFSQLTKDIINPLINRLNSIDSAEIVKRKSYTEEQIKDRYQSRFNIPILIDDQYKKGVYKNFNEFRNNAPSISNFKIKRDRIANLLYDSSDNLISLKIFGYCDGITCWIQNGAYYFPLVRVGNSFEFFYTYYIPLRYSNYVVKLLLALNMETGKID
jgi:hypothetical protein